MRILVTNDDGIHARGLVLVAQSLRAVGDVMVIAPESQQSAVGHGITLHKPLRLDPVDLGPDIEAYSTNGTPADCVILGTLGDLPCPDIVVSGINAGANLGEEVLYSGTVSAALEAALHDVPGMAISVCAYEDVIYDAAVDLAPRVVETLLGNPLGCGTIVNVNVPNIPPSEICGMEMTRLGRRKYDDIVIRREDPRGRPYYWFSGGPTEADRAPGTDIHAIMQNRVSLTLVHFDLTSQQRWEGFELLSAAQSPEAGASPT